MNAPNNARQVLVTGGTKGIGRAVALRLAAAGHHVTCVYRGDEEGKKACEAAAREKGLLVRTEQADLADPAQVSALFDRLGKDGRDPDWVVNAAGLSRDSAFVFTGPADLDLVLGANLKSTFYVCQQAAKGMVRKRKGRIVNFTSPAALIGNEGQAAYAAAKGGIIGLTRTLARELARYNVTVNCVSPGLVPTEMSSSLPEARVKQIIARTPLRRTGTPEEVAATVDMLLDDLAGYVTGQVIAIDGGLT